MKFKEYIYTSTLFVLLVIFILILDPFGKSQVATQNKFDKVKASKMIVKEDKANSLDHRAKATIPKIIHQIWNDENVPTEFVGNIQGLVRDNPDPEWKYYLWTKASALKLISKKYPFLYQKANDTSDMLRSDLFRYLVIYEYGGVFFDLDTVSVKPLRNFVQHHTCTLAHEPREHLFEGKRDLLIATASLLCVRKHPFFTHIILHLATVYKSTCQAAFACTGPQFLTWMYKHLNRTDNYAGPLPEVQEPEVFQDMYDVSRQKAMIEKECNDTSVLPSFKRAICVKWLERGKDKRNISEYALTYHTWYHVNANKIRKFKFVHIKEVVPHAKIYGKDFF